LSTEEGRLNISHLI